ncbi:hypothetical protein OSB04_028129 [Centaurea solstitialis]|uniref:Uncharacterized protein n=1 Tax=Centaurea solstitialis TaxID=347529 RepID=A0AA38SMJ0_9ASTR|nr:hypothetical protein OSB04_028129 [Centaurea solstitialis]
MRRSTQRSPKAMPKSFALTSGKNMLGRTKSINQTTPETKYGFMEPWSQSKTKHPRKQIRRLEKLGNTKPILNRKKSEKQSLNTPKLELKVWIMPKFRSWMPSHGEIMHLMLSKFIPYRDHASDVVHECSSISFGVEVTRSKKKYIPVSKKYVLDLNGDEEYWEHNLVVLQ